MRATWALCLLSLSLLGACGGDTGLDVTPLRAGSGSGSGTGSATGCTAGDEFDGACTAVPPGSVNCAELLACCPALPAVAQGECETLAQSNVDAQCASALAELAAVGDCIGGSGGGG